MHGRLALVAPLFPSCHPRFRHIQPTAMLGLRVANVLPGATCQTQSYHVGSVPRSVKLAHYTLPAAHVGAHLSGYCSRLATTISSRPMTSSGTRNRNTSDPACCRVFVTRVHCLTFQQGEACVFLVPKRYIRDQSQRFAETPCGERAAASTRRTYTYCTVMLAL